MPKETKGGRIIGIRAAPRVSEDMKYLRRGDGARDVEEIIAFVKEKGPTTLKEIAAELFKGDYRKVCNLIRIPVAQGRLIKVGVGTYEYQG